MFAAIQREDEGGGTPFALFSPFFLQEGSEARNIVDKGT